MNEPDVYYKIIDNIYSITTTLMTAYCYACLIKPFFFEGVILSNTKNADMDDLYHIRLYYAFSSIYALLYQHHTCPRHRHLRCIFCHVPV